VSPPRLPPSLELIWITSFVLIETASRFIIGYAVAVPSAALVISYHNYRLTDPNRGHGDIDAASKRKTLLIHLSIGLGIPIVEMAVQYVVEGHRFDIYEELGCFPFTYNTPMAVVLVDVLPLIIGLISMYFSGESATFTLY
jgi:pheromone a factor receptor